MTALTEWWTDMGVSVDTALVDAMLKVAPEPELAQRAIEPTTSVTTSAPVRKGARTVSDWTDEARVKAGAAQSLDILAAAIRTFEGSPLRTTCEQAVVSDGIAGASLMVIGEGPGAEEDRRGLPFVGKAGQLLDKMLAAIGRSRAENAFITNVNYWRPPGNRNPETDELAVCRPFVDRMIELTAPKLIIAAGGVPAVSLLASKDGIMKLRGNEYAYATPAGFQVPIIPVLHPAYLLRRPQDKSRAWRDLMLIEKRLAELGG
jgi:DNA polymerase